MPRGRSGATPGQDQRTKRPGAALGPGLKVAFHSRFNSVAPGRASAKPAILVMRRLRNRKCEGLADAGAANPFALPRNSLVGVVEVPGVGQQARRQMSLSGTMKITGLSSPRRLRSSHL